MGNSRIFISTVHWINTLYLHPETSPISYKIAFFARKADCHTRFSNELNLLHSCLLLLHTCTVVKTRESPSKRNYFWNIYCIATAMFAWESGGSSDSSTCTSGKAAREARSFSFSQDPCSFPSPFHGFATCEHTNQLNCQLFRLLIRQKKLLGKKTIQKVAICHRSKRFYSTFSSKIQAQLLLCKYWTWLSLFCL